MSVPGPACSRPRTCCIQRYSLLQLSDGGNDAIKPLSIINQARQSVIEGVQHCLRFHSVQGERCLEGPEGLQCIFAGLLRRGRGHQRAGLSNLHWCAFHSLHPDTRLDLIIDAGQCGDLYFHDKPSGQVSRKHQGVCYEPKKWAPSQLAGQGLMMLQALWMAQQSLTR